MAEILIVGSSSAIAQDFCDKAVDSFHVVTASSSKSADLKIDFRDTQLPNISEAQFTHAIIFSSATDIREIEENFSQAEVLTLGGPAKLISKLNMQGVRCMIISTTAVFDEGSTEMTEESNAKPSSIYGKLKLELEHLTLKSPLNAVMRITKVFSGNCILSQWKDLIVNDKEINCFTDLKVAPLPIEFVSRALIKWIEEPYHGISHVSPDKDMSYYQLGLYLARIMGKSDAKVKGVKAGQSIKYKPQKAYLDCEGPFSQKYSLEKCIDVVIKQSI